MRDDAAALRSQIQRRTELRASKLVPECEQQSKTIVINHRAAMIHLPHPDEPRRTVCPYVKSTAPDHYGVAEEDTENLHLYIRCSSCFKPAHVPLDMPKWDIEEPTGDTGLEASGSSCAGDDSSDSS